MLNSRADVMCYRKWTSSLDRFLAKRRMIPQADGKPGTRSQRLPKMVRQPNGLPINDRNLAVVWLGLLIHADDLTVTPTTTNVSYERIAQMGLITYRDVSDAVAVLAMLGFVQTKRRRMRTNVTRLFLNQHLPVETWVDLPRIEQASFADLEAEAVDLQKRIASRDIDSGPKSSPKKAGAQRIAADIDILVAGLETIFPDHNDFRVQDGKAWLRRCITECIDKAGDPKIGVAVLHEILAAETPELDLILNEIGYASRMGPYIVREFPGWLEQYSAADTPTDTLSSTHDLDEHEIDYNEVSL